MTNRPKAVVMKMPECPVVFYLPRPAMTLSAYAQMTNQTVRTVQQQANAGKLVLTREKPGKERQVNMVYEFLSLYLEAEEALRHKL